MPFTLIKGTFHVIAYSPDGDSVKFEANNPKNWDKISGHHKIKQTKGRAQLRFEGIDALETHYQPKVKGATKVGQPLGQVARDFTLKALGIKNVKWGPGGNKVVSADDGVPGYIITRDADIFGRPISFVFAGAAPEADGSSLNFDTARLQKTINYKLIQSGMAYPTYYRTLFSDLRDELTKAVKKARAAKKGLWPKDKTSGFVFNGIKSITQANPIFPKLFRRLVEHVQSGGQIGTFIKFLGKKADGVLILPQAHHTSALDTVVQVKGKKVAMTVLPENLVFDPQ